MGLRSRTVDPTPILSISPRTAPPAMSREERLARLAMAAHDAERAAFVAELRRSVWSGAYDPSAEEIAAAVLANRECDTESTP